MEVPRDGRPAKCTRRRLLNADDQNPENNEAKTRKRLKLLGCRKLANRSQPLVGRSSPYCDDMWRRYYCL